MALPKLVDKEDYPPLAREELVRIHDLMVKARVLEERLIQMYKQGDGYFWIGGPGEEAFNVPLGLLDEEGPGPDYDYLHLHYRSSGTLLAMGAEPDRRAPADEEHGDRPVLAAAATSRATTRCASGTSCRSARRSRCSTRWRPAPRMAQKRARRRRHHHRHRRRRRHGRGRLRDLPGLELAPGQRAAACSSSSPTTSGASPPPCDGQHGETRIADRGKAFGMRDRDHRRQRSRDALPRAQGGDGLRAHRAQAVPARGDGVAALRPLVGVAARTS